jgi:hypothetical protein
MNTDNWEYVFKTEYRTKETIETNLVYTPLTYDNVFCMSFDHASPYQNEMLHHIFPQRPFYTEEMVTFLFNREVEFINRFKDKPWTPNYLDIDLKSKKIFFEWPGETFNRIVTDGSNITTYCQDWEDQLENIILDLYNEGCYKLTLYPHCFFNDNGIMKTFDFYACTDITDRYIDVSLVQGMLGIASPERFEKAIKDSKLDLKELFAQALNGYSMWPTDRLKKLAAVVL